MHATCRCFWVQRVAELLGAPLFVSLQHYIARGCTSMLSIPQLAAGCGFNGECFAHRLFLNCACTCVSIMQEDIGSSTQRC